MDPLPLSHLILSKELLGTWLINLVQSESREIFHLSQAQEAPTNTAAGLQAFLFTIHDTALTLLDLNIRDRFFPPNKAKVVVNTMSGRLKWLTMNVIHLDIELLDLLVQTLPCLEELRLIVMDVVSSDEVSFF